MGFNDAGRACKHTPHTEKAKEPSTTWIKPPTRTLYVPPHKRQNKTSSGGSSMELGSVAISSSKIDKTVNGGRENPTKPTVPSSSCVNTPSSEAVGLPSSSVNGYVFVSKDDTVSAHGQEPSKASFNAVRSISSPQFEEEDVESQHDATVAGTVLKNPITTNGFLPADDPLIYKASLGPTWEEFLFNRGFAAGVTPSHDSWFFIEKQTDKDRFKRNVKSIEENRRMTIDLATLTIEEVRGKLRLYPLEEEENANTIFDSSGLTPRGTIGTIKSIPFEM